MFLFAVGEPQPVPFCEEGRTSRRPPRTASAAAAHLPTEAIWAGILPVGTLSAKISLEYRKSLKWGIVGARLGGFYRQIRRKLYLTT